jgi:GntP family gluconate:H+ symporter
LLILHLLIAILIILVLILKYKFSPVIALALGALYYGIATGLGPVESAGLIASGFGNTMTGIGLVVGFGCIVGQLLADSGGIHAIVKAILNTFPPHRTPEALTAAGLVVSTPVFFDVAFVIMSPMAKALAKVANMPRVIMAIALYLGTGAAHMLIPPTPGPLAVAETLGVPLGQMILYGALLAVPTSYISLWLWKRIILRSNFWKPEEDEEEIDGEQEEYVAPDKMPSLGLSLLPVMVPVILIILGSIAPYIATEGTSFDTFVRFVGNKNVAMLIGALLAMVVAATTLDGKELSRSVNSSLTSAGTVLLITGAGGSLGAVLGATNIGKVIADSMASYSIPVIVLAWLIGALIRVAQGSGTVALVTTANLMAPALAQMSPGYAIWVALAICSGAAFGGHVNDSGFWIVTRLSGITVKGGLKMYTLNGSISAFIRLAVLLVASAIFMR